MDQNPPTTFSLNNVDAIDNPREQGARLQAMQMDISSPKLKQDRRKRKTWVWVVEPTNPQEPSEPVDIEVNNLGRARRSCSKKAVESISATLQQRKNTTLIGNSSAKNKQRMKDQGDTVGSSRPYFQEQKHSSLEKEHRIFEDGRCREEKESKPQQKMTTTISAESIMQSSEEIESTATNDPNSPSSDDFIVVVDDLDSVAASISSVSINQMAEGDKKADEEDRMSKNEDDEKLEEDDNRTRDDSPKLTSIKTPLAIPNLYQTAIEENLNTIKKPPTENFVNIESGEKKVANINGIPISISKQEKAKQKKDNKIEESTEPSSSAATQIVSEEIPLKDWPPFPQYKEIEENMQLCKDAESKESKSIQCDCKHSSKELKRGLGCGEQCLNRLLLMECRGGCPSGKYCANKRFQRRDYAELETFYTGAKGWGVRAKKDIAKGQFIIEYVGEVIDAREMQRRIKRYGRDPNHKHHYLMALRSGAVIDATTHGNQSRFINHSCDPNAITQKWTVGRQLRIGFFAKRPIKLGEEVVFNYQFERYGKRAQKCFCGSQNCTGYIGATGREDSGVDSNAESGAESVFSSDSSDGDESEPKGSVDLSKSSQNEVKRKRGRPSKSTGEAHQKRTKKKSYHANLISQEIISDPTLREASEVNEILLKGALRNREQVLEFNRLMVRVDQLESRRRMVDFLLRIDDPNILRLFVANQGLALIRIWFVLPPFERRALQLQSQIARLLLRLPVNNKNQVDEVCIMSTLNQLINLELPDKYAIKDMVNQLADYVAEQVDGPNADVKSTQSATVREFETLRQLAEQLASNWANLVDTEFRIPKKLSKSVSKLVSKGMEAIQNSFANKNNSKFQSKWHRHYANNDQRNYIVENEGEQQNGDEAKIDYELSRENEQHRSHLYENDREWQYRRFRSHFEKRFRRRGGRPFYRNNFNGRDKKYLGGQLYNDPEDEPPPTFFNAPPRTIKQEVKEAAAYSASPNTPTPPPTAIASPALNTPNLATATASPHQHQFFPVVSPSAPMIASFFTPASYIYYNTQSGGMVAMPMHEQQQYPPPPPPPPPPMVQNTDADEAEMEMDEGEEDIKTATKSVPASSAAQIPLPSTSSIKKEIIEKDNNNRKTDNEGKKDEEKNVKPKREKQKTAKDLIKESLQRRIQSLKAQLGTKASPTIWTGEGKKEKESGNIVGRRSRSGSISSLGGESRSPSVESCPNSSSPSMEQQKEFGKGREDDNRKSKQGKERSEEERRRRREREEEEAMKKRRSGEGGCGRGHGSNERSGGGRRRSSLSPDRTGGTDPNIDRRSRRRGSSPGRRGGRGGRIIDRARGACRRRGSRHFCTNEIDASIRKRSIAGGGWPRHISDANNVPRRRGGTYDRIRAQLAKQALEKQLKEQQDQEKSKLSPEEEKHRQQKQSTKKAAINMYTERLKGLLQPEQHGNSNMASQSPSASTYSERSELDAIMLEMNMRAPAPHTVVDSHIRTAQFRTRTTSTSSTTSTSTESSSSSKSSTSSSTSTTTTTSSSSAISSTALPKAEHKKTKEQLKGENVPQLKRQIGAVLASDTQPHPQTFQAPTPAANEPLTVKKPTMTGRFVPAFTIAKPKTNIVPVVGASAAVAKAFGSSDGGGVECTTSLGVEKTDSKVLSKCKPDEKQKLVTNTDEKQPSKGREGKQMSWMKERQDDEDDEEKEDEADEEGGMLQPPRVTVDVLSQSERMDGYIHQLKEFVYFMETLRRDMHGPPPMPSSMAAALRQQHLPQFTKHHNPVQPKPSTKLAPNLNAVQIRQSQGNQLAGKSIKTDGKKAMKREMTAKEDSSLPSTSQAGAGRLPSLSTIHPTPAKRARTSTAEKARLQQVDQAVHDHREETSGSASIQSNTPPEDPRTNCTAPELRTAAVVSASSALFQPQQSQLSLSSAVTTTIISEPVAAARSPQPVAAVSEQPTTTASQSIVADPFRHYPSLLGGGIGTSALKVEIDELKPDLGLTIPPPSTTSSMMDTMTTATSRDIFEGFADEQQQQQASSTTVVPAPLMSKSGLWLGAKDADGALYFYHRDTREARWDLPEGEELLILDQRISGTATTSALTKDTAVTQTRRAEFKRDVSMLVAKSIEPYRRSFFPSNNEYTSFLRKITHKVLDNQPKAGNHTLLFNEQVQKNTQRLVKEYIQHFKRRESATTLVHHQHCPTAELTAPFPPLSPK